MPGRYQELEDSSRFVVHFFYTLSLVSSGDHEPDVGQRVRNRNPSVRRLSINDRLTTLDGLPVDLHGGRTGSFFFLLDKGARRRGVRKKK